jgi:Flp pilus assembly secretin CpaC
MLDEKLAELKVLQAEVERLQQAASVEPEQLVIHVRLFEAYRTKFKGAGIELGDGGVVGLLADRKAEPAPGEPPTSYRLEVLETDADRDANLAEWRRLGLIKLLAEPRLTTVSDRPVSFNAGGEFPILVPQSLGAVSIQYRKFGTQFDFAPHVLDDGRIRLELRPRLSWIDDQRSISINGTSVPGLRVREFDAVGVLAPGQTLLAGGMTEFREQRTKKKDGKREKTVDEVETLILATVEKLGAFAVPRNAHTTEEAHAQGAPSKR